MAVTSGPGAAGDAGAVELELLHGAPAGHDRCADGGGLAFQGFKLAAQLLQKLALFLKFRAGFAASQQLTAEFGNS